MQTLVFNTTTKTAKLYEGEVSKSTLLFDLQNVPTVKIEDGFYQVMQTEYSLSPESKEPTRVPVARFPIANTNMLIQK